VAFPTARGKSLYAVTVQPAAASGRVLRTPALQDKVRSPGHRRCNPAAFAPAPVEPIAPALVEGAIAKPAQVASAISANKGAACGTCLAIALFSLAGWTVTLPISTVTIRIHNHRTPGSMDGTGGKNSCHGQSQNKCFHHYSLGFRRAHCAPRINNKVLPIASKYSWASRCLNLLL